MRIDYEGPCELLTSAWLHGAWHAIYPTALATMCGKSCGGKGSEEAIPTCETCVEVTRRMFEIDRSCPRSWIKPLELERAPTSKQLLEGSHRRFR